MKKLLIEIGVYAIIMVILAFGTPILRERILRSFTLVLVATLGVMVLVIGMVIRRAPQWLAPDYRRPTVRQWAARAATALLTIGLVSLLVRLPLTGRSVVEWLHWFVFATLGAVWFARHRGRYRWFVTLAAGLAFPIFDEWLQALASNRIGDPRDVLLDATAWMIGAWFLHAMVTSPSTRTPAEMAAAVCLWVFTGIMLLIGYDWFFGTYIHPVQVRDRLYRIPSRLAIPSIPGPAFKLKLIRSLYRRTIVHEKTRWLAEMTGDSTCAPAAEQAFVHWLHSSKSRPNRKQQSRITCAPNEIPRWIATVLLGIWWFLIPILALSASDRFHPIPPTTGPST